jgi:hypothetical protein
MLEKMENHNVMGNYFVSHKTPLRKRKKNVVQEEEDTHHNPSLEITEDETFNEEESFTFQSVFFGRESKKLIIEKIDVNNKKGKYRSEVDLRDMWPF